MKPASLLLLFLFAACAASVQAVDPLKTKALTFGFDGLALSGPHGANVGGKIWLSGNRALGLGVLGSATRLTHNSGDSTSFDIVSRGQVIGVRASLEQHADLGGRFSPYVVGSTSLRFSRYRSHVEDVYTYRQREFFLELSGGAGLEWWFARRLSLTGQQLFSANLSFGNTKLDDAFNRDNRRFSMGIGTSSFMLNVYL